MTDLVEEIGPILGIAAFLGLAILAFLIFQQAREVRRLREWAGRAPERAAEAHDATLAAAEARGEAAAGEDEGLRGRLAARWAAFRGWFAPRYAALDRRMPVDPRYLLAVIAAGVIAAAVLTSGFGLFGGEDGNAKGGGGKGGDKKEKVVVAVLNATQEESAVTGEEIAGVQGLASKVADKVVKPAGFKPGVETDAANGINETAIMFDTGEGEREAARNERDAGKLAAAVADELGETNVIPMTSDVRERSEGAPIALVIGADDADF